MVVFVNDGINFFLFIVWEGLIIIGKWVNCFNVVIVFKFKILWV